LDIKSGNCSFHVQYYKSQPPRVKAKARSSVAILMKSKRDEVAIINIVKAQVEELYFIFNLEYRLPLYQEEYYIDCQQSLNKQRSLKTQVR
jgi:homoserine trans-succinylase